MAGGADIHRTEDRTRSEDDLERRRAPTRSPSFWKQVVDAMVEGIAVCDGEGVIIEANPAFCSMFGYERAEVVGQAPPYSFWPPEHLPAITSAFAGSMRGQRGEFEHILCRKDGTRFPAIIRATTALDQGGRPSILFASFQDVSSRKALEDQSRSAEQRWRSIAENPFDFVSIIDRDCKYVYMNHTVEGVLVEDMVGKKTPFDYVEPRYHAMMRRSFDHVFQTGTATSYDIYVEFIDRWYSNILGPVKSDGTVVGVSILTRDVTDSKRAEVALQKSEHRLQLATAGGDVGVFDIEVGATTTFYSSPRLDEILGYDETVPPPGDSLEERLRIFEAHVHPDDRAATKAALKAVMSGGPPFDHEYRVAPPGKPYRWVHGKGRHFTGPDGAQHFSGFVTDITEKKEAELRRDELESRLRQVQKMDTLGRLSAGVAHDFNNMLVPILGNAELMLGEAGSESPFRSGLEDIIHAATRARELAGRILVFGRNSDEEARPTNVVSIVHEVVRFLRASAPKGVEIRELADEESPDIMGSAAHIHQAVTNLCVNAVQALKGRSGRVTVEVAPVAIDTTFALRHRLEVGSALRVVVQDDGPGMTKEVLEHAFEPFFTTKPVGEGSGLGLSLVHGIVRQHQGAIVTESSPGHGARFELYFPLRAPATKSGDLAETESTPPVSGACRRILCVDDDATVLRVIVRIFSRAGHLVTAVSSPAEALARLRKNPGDFDVIVSDQTMPSLTGTELAAQAFELRRDLPVILLSGIAGQGLSESAPPNVRACLQKPLTARALLQAVDLA